MTELEKMERAKMYINKLANGIDPISDEEIPDDAVLNQVRLSRCFFYVETLLDGVIARERRAMEPKKPRKKDLPLFSLTPEQKQQVSLTQEPLSISRFAAAVNAVADLETMQKLKATDLTAWLVRKGLLQESIRNDKRYKDPSPAGKAMGITSEWKDSFSGGHYLHILYSREVQDFLLDNLETIVTEMQGEDAQASSSAD